MVGTHCGFSRPRKSLCSQPVAKPRALLLGVAPSGRGWRSLPLERVNTWGAQRPADRSLFIPSPGGRRQGEQLSLPPARRVFWSVQGQGSLRFVPPPVTGASARAAASARSPDLDRPLGDCRSNVTAQQEPGGRRDGARRGAGSPKGRDKPGTGAGSMRSTT